MKKLAMKNYRQNVKIYSILYKYGIISEQEVKVLFGEALSEIVSQQINENLNEIYQKTCRTYFKGVINA